MTDYSKYINSDLQLGQFFSYNMIMVL